VEKSLDMTQKELKRRIAATVAATDMDTHVQQQVGLLEAVFASTPFFSALAHQCRLLSHERKWAPPSLQLPMIRSQSRPPLPRLPDQHRLQLAWLTMTTTWSCCLLRLRRTRAQPPD
jgi:hypothetical protein